MEQYLPTLVIALSYAFIRAFHDSHIREGGWKPWAVVEAIFWTIIITGYITKFAPLNWMALSVIFGLTFSLFFDMIVGKLFGGSFFYLGSGKWDRMIEQIFIDGKFWAFCKLAGIIGFSGLYFAIINS